MVGGAQGDSKERALPRIFQNIQRWVTKDGPVAGCDNDFVLRAVPTAATTSASTSPESLLSASSTDYTCQLPTQPPGQGWIPAATTNSWVIPAQLQIAAPVEHTQCPAGTFALDGQCVRPCDDPDYEVVLGAPLGTTSACRRIIPTWYFDAYHFLQFSPTGKWLGPASPKTVSTNSQSYAMLIDTGNRVYWVEEKPMNTTGLIASNLFQENAPVPVSDNEAIQLWGLTNVAAIRKHYNLKSLDNKLFSLTKDTKAIAAVLPQIPNDKQIPPLGYTDRDEYSRRVLPACPRGFATNRRGVCVRSPGPDGTCPLGWIINKDGTECHADTTFEVMPTRHASLIARVAIIGTLIGIALAITALVNRSAKNNILRRDAMAREFARARR